MIAQSEFEYTNLDTITHRAQQYFAQMTEYLGNVNVNKLAKCLAEFRVFVDSMVLATDDYDLAVSRIVNAQRYLDSQESGAAKYEIKQLICTLQNRLAMLGRHQVKTERNEPQQGPLGQSKTRPVSMQLEIL